MNRRLTVRGVGRRALSSGFRQNIVVVVSSSSTISDVREEGWREVVARKWREDELLSSCGGRAWLMWCVVVGGGLCRSMLEVGCKYH